MQSSQFVSPFYDISLWGHFFVDKLWVLISMLFMCFQVACVSESLTKALILFTCWASRSLLH